MPLLGALLMIIDLTFAIHVYRTGRPLWWIAIIFGFPVLGSLAYFLMEVFPTLGATTHVKRVIKVIDPGADMRSRLNEVETCGSMSNKTALADECINSGLFDDAINLYSSCMTGPYQDDPVLEFGMAEALFYKRDFGKAGHWFEKLLEHNPTYKSGDARLLYARSLELSGEFERALAQYEVLAPQYAGEEVRCRYAMLLKQRGRTEAATRVFEEIERKVRRAPAHYRRSQREWTELAKREKPVAQ